MSKVIAIWGAPNSGKTTFATKLARSIYDEYQATVIVVYADNETPTLPIIFPNYKKEDLCSVGVALSKTDIDRHEVVRQMVTVKDKQNFCFLGFTDGENKYTYPAFDATKVRSLYSVLASLADYVIIDCTSSLKNPLSKVAVREADEVIRLSAPNLKSVSYLASQLPLYIDPMFRLEEHIQGICVTDADLYMPIDEAKAQLHDVRFTIPYSRAVKQQMLDGNLYEVVKQMVTVKDKQNFCFLGFTDGENKYTYPAFDATKVRSLYSVLASLADYVIIDCTSSLKNPLSKVAVREADEVIRLSAPNLKSVSYLASQLPLYIDPMFRLEEHIQGICVTDADLYMPIDEAKAQLHDVRFTIPYSRAVKQQMLDGNLYEVVNDKKFNDKFKAIVEKVV